ncbi:winged helix-turn-helix domain-containing protein [Haliangium sp.]|uniref:winged helix-turn-helix transcriptional regulator n=1 Tax=Haliangium sp. TaxID=2663208 RepID=UPI003D119E13
MFETLRREIPEVSLENHDVFEGAPDPDRPVFLLWAPPGLSSEFYHRVVAWADAIAPRLGLLGCAAEGAVGDSECALAAGFDDYVAGRHSPRELAARVRAVHRRLHWPSRRWSGCLKFGPLVLHPHEHELRLDGDSIPLTTIEMAVVRALIRAGGRPLHRADLLDRAWGENGLDVSERAVDNVILRLRRKLPRAGLIRTVRGVGFCLDPG